MKLPLVKTVKSSVSNPANKKKGLRKYDILTAFKMKTCGAIFPVVRGSRSAAEFGARMALFSSGHAAGTTDMMKTCRQSAICKKDGRGAIMFTPEASLTRRKDFWVFSGPFVYYNRQARD